jgi:hypothetical protein
MNTNNAPVTKLGSLPNEILLQIFGLFSFKEIIKTFSGLNFYLDSTIRSINDGNLHVHLNDVESVNHINLYPNQIRRLILIHSPNVNFMLSINLRSLTIKYGTISQINSIRPEHFPMLEILHICGGK